MPARLAPARYSEWSGRPLIIRGSIVEQTNQSLSKLVLASRALYKLFLDPTQLIMFLDPFAAPRCARFEVARAERYGEICDERIHSLPAVVRHDCTAARVIGQMNCGDRLGERTDLFEL